MNLVWDFELCMDEIEVLRAKNEELREELREKEKVLKLSIFI